MKKLLLITPFLLLFAFNVSAQTQHTITMDASNFIPAEITISEGDVIVWSNTSSIVHTSTSGSNCSPDGIWSSGDIAPGATFSRTFTAAGSYPYYCFYHCGIGMVGTVTVQQVTGSKNKTESSSLKINNLFPNPADNNAVLQYTLEKPADVNIEIVNNVGTVIKTMPAGFQSGNNETSLDLSGLPSGIYYCFIVAGSERTGTMISVK